MIYRNIVLFGAPGTGKGGYGRLLSKTFEVPVFSMGDYLRGLMRDEQARATPDPWVKSIKHTLAQGKLIDDEMVVDIVSKVRKTLYRDTETLILDGVPRTVNQANMLKQQMHVDTVLNLSIQRDVLQELLMGRVTCPCCSRSYNTAFIDRDGYYLEHYLPKKNPAQCDDCEVDLVVRNDDKEGPIKQRMQIYEQETAPILEFFRNDETTNLIDFQPKRGISDFPKVRDLLEPYFKVNAELKM